MEQRLALLSRCAIQFLPTFDCLYKTLSSFCLHSLPLLYLQKGFFTQFQFLWHCMVLIYVYFVPVLAVSQCYLALTTRRMSNELCAARQDTRCTRVYASLFGDLPCQLIALFTANLYATFLFISLNCLICIKRQATVSGLETDREMEMRVNTQRTNCLCLDRHSGIRGTTSKRQIKVIIKPKGASSPRAPRKPKPQK